MDLDPWEQKDLSEYHARWAMGLTVDDTIILRDLGHQQGREKNDAQTMEEI